MKTQMKKQDLSEFIEFSLGKKEVSLLIAADKKELKKFKKELLNQDFSEEKNIYDFVQSVKRKAKIFIEYTQDLKKDLYEFIIQYPSGQIYFFDTEKKESVFVTPNYQKNIILILITKNDLESLESSGFNILQNVGLTYKSK